MPQSMTMFIVGAIRSYHETASENFNSQNITYPTSTAKQQKGGPWKAEVGFLLATWQ
jgi:hypothetical protein